MPVAPPSYPSVPHPIPGAGPSNTSSKQQQSQEILEDDPACSVGEPQKEIEQPATNEKTPQKTVDESSSVSTVQSNHGEFQF